MAAPGWLPPGRVSSDPGGEGESGKLGEWMTPELNPEGQESG